MTLAHTYRLGGRFTLRSGDDAIHFSHTIATPIRVRHSYPLKYGQNNIIILLVKMMYSFLSDKTVVILIYSLINTQK